METGTWIGVTLTFGMSLLALVKSIASDSNARQLAKDKAESDRLAARDRMEFDSKLLTLQIGHAECQQTSAKQESTIAELKKKVAELEKRDDKDRNELESKIAAITPPDDETPLYRPGS